MKKYGVEETPPAKTAAEGEMKCPRCGRPCSELDSGAGLWLCPVHGTEPFEGDMKKGEA